MPYNSEGEYVEDPPFKARSKTIISSDHNKIPVIPGNLGQSDKPVKSDDPVEPDVVGDADEECLDQLERLKQLKAWQGFSPVQRRIITWKFLNPTWTPRQVAAKVGCQLRVVLGVMHSEGFDEVINELARADMLMLRLEALNVYRGLLRASRENVRREAAKDILEDGKIIKKPEKVTSHSREIKVTWRQAPPELPKE